MAANLEALLDRFLAAGDLRAMEEIVAATRGSLLGVARRIGREEAEDAVQAAYHSLLRRVARGPLDAPVLPWLLTTVVRISYRRKALHRREAALADRLAIERAPGDPAAAAGDAERDRLLRSELARLPDPYRDALYLHHFEGLTVAEVAALLDEPVPTVKARLQRGRRLLRGRLSPSLLYGVLVLPWLLADAARAGGTALGVTMKTKSALATLLLLAIALTAFVGRGGLGGRREGEVQRAASRPLAVEGDRASAAEGERAPAAAAPLPAPVDFLAVDPDLDLHGVVVDRAGAPVAGAELAAVRYPWRRANLLDIEAAKVAVPEASARSAADGSFRIRLARGTLVNLRVRAPGFAPFELREAQAGERVRVRLSRGVTLLVRARNEAGEPLPGVALRLFPRRPLREFDLEAAGRTGPDGAFRFEGLPSAAMLWLEPTHERLGHPGFGWLEVDLPDEGESAIEVTMPPGRRISGRVTDGATGAPIAGARVGLGWTYRKPVRTGADGRYAIDGYAAEGLHEVAADAEGYGEAILEVGDASEVDFALKPGRTVFGRAVDPAGRPVPGAIVAAIGSLRVEGVQNVSKRFGTTDPQGRFRLADLRPDIVHALTLMAPGRGRTLLEFDPERHEDLGDIVIPEGRAIEGRVLDERGRPLERIEVGLEGANDDRFRLVGASPFNWYGNEEERPTDHLGRFRFPDLAPGHYRLDVRPPGRIAVSREVTLTAESDLRDVELRFAESREVLVRVRDDEGRPLRNVVVSATCGDERVDVTTGVEGSAPLRVPGPIDRLAVWALPVGGETRDFLETEPVEGIDEAETEVTVVLRRAARIEGRLLLPEGGPLAKGVVAARRGEEPAASATTDAEGRFALRVPPRESYRVVFLGIEGPEGWDLATEYAGEIEGVEAPSGAVVLSLRREPLDRSFRVRLLDPEGKPVEGVLVTASPRPEFLPTDAAGTAEFTRLPARKTEVRFHPSPPKSPPDLLLPPPAELLPAGQEIAVRLERGVPVRGTVELEEGKLVAGLPIYARIGERSIGGCVADAEGRFTIYVPADPAGPVTVHSGFAAGTLFQEGTVGDVGPDSGPIRLVLAPRR